MRHRRPADRGNASLNRCEPCGTLSHPSRLAARQFMRTSQLSMVSNHVYACPLSPGRYHIGDGRQPEEGAPLTAMTELPGEAPDDLPTDPYANGASAFLELLFADLATYRYVPNVPVTPALAKRLIELDFKNNRNLKVRLRDRLAKDMANDNWFDETGQTLKIAQDGFMIDGKHRMHAVVASGKTIVFDLCFGIDPNKVVVVDTGGARTTADSVRIAGGHDLYRTDSIIRWVFAWDRGSPMGANGGRGPTNIETLREYQRDPGGYDTAAARGHDCNRRKLGPASVPGIGYYLIARENKEGADDFYDMLVSGAYGVADPTSMSVYHLREALRQRNRLTRQEMLALIIVAWNRRFEVIQKFQLPRGGISNAHFPKPTK